MTDAAQSNGFVTAAYSRRMRVRLQDGQEVDARIKGKKIKPVCGDRVNVQPIDGESDWLITAIANRDNALTRPDARGRIEVLAANLDCVVVMAAHEPSPDWFIVDRYIAAAENMPAAALVVYNKTDLLESDFVEPGVLDEYRSAGYEVITCSAETGRNLDKLARALSGRTSIVVGQSGVGKSSVINQLVGSELPTAALSRKFVEGRHTTVSSIMLDIPGGGFVVDSPGVRDYAPAIESEDEVTRGFREISKTGEQCRFANCRHLREPDCAVKAAVDTGKISERRYESYKRLSSLVRGLADSRY